MNRFKVTFPAVSANEFFARGVVSAFVTQLDPTIEELNDIKTAVSEAVTNAIVHAYDATVGPVTITGEILSNHTIRLKIKDKGCGIPDVKKAMEPLFTTVGGERAGLGFAVMESFSDLLQVKSTVGRGTTVTLIKQIKLRVGAHADA